MGTSPPHERPPSVRRTPGNMAAIRRNTLQLARDVFLRRFSRVETASAGTTVGRDYTSIDDVVWLVHDVSLQVAAYRQAVQTIGTSADGVGTRKELDTARRQCLKACDNTKNSVLPQLKSETHEGLQSSEFTKQASQFIGCLSAFVNEMRRYEALSHTFPLASALAPSSSEGGRTAASMSTDADVVTGTGSARTDEHQQQMLSLSKDIGDAESMLETLENLITVHFSTKDQPGDKVEPPRRRGRGCRLDCICSNFKTSYA